MPIMLPDRCEGFSQYVATADLKLAVNAAITLERPLLIKGEPGWNSTSMRPTSRSAPGNAKRHSLPSW
ncbi:hypothetical protein IHE31_12580 [Mycetohabitans rhizoxinica]|uniref:hypothetical protein n=1 Tax=Mycetohabitans rhizoxinica TaxID=412963 RepID=UPI0030CB9DE8